MPAEVHEWSRAAVHLELLDAILVLTPVCHCSVWALVCRFICVSEQVLVQVKAHLVRSKDQSDNMAARLMAWVKAASDVFEAVHAMYQDVDTKVNYPSITFRALFSVNASAVRCPPFHLFHRDLLRHAAASGLD